MAEVRRTAAGAALAEQIVQDLGGETADGPLIVVITEDAAADAAINAAIEAAQDRNRAIIPALAETAALPRSIEHLEPLDFREGYDRAALIDRLNAAGDFHMKVLTPATRRANRRFALIFVALALLMFVAGLILVGVFGVQAPSDEYEQVETEIVLTRDYFVEQALPRSTEDALNFPATVDAARPSLEPVLIATATAQAQQDE
jgi:hypothetical protein